LRLYVSFENETGKIEMGRHLPVWISSVEGLEQPAAEGNVKKFAGLPGQKTGKRLNGARAITITGSIVGGRQTIVYNRDLMARVYNNTLAPGVLRFNLYGKMRRADAMADSFAVGKLSNGRREFIVSFTCDSPYFQDWYDTVINLFRRENNLFAGMTFPRVFTFRYAGGNAINSCGVDIEPVVIIRAGPPGAFTAPGITITNETTGAYIRLDYTPPANDVITVNVRDRKITSSINGNITHKKPVDNLLSQFVLKKGGNVIRFEKEDAEQELTADIIYSNLYAEAVY
jgi:hypothetical protein